MDLFKALRALYEEREKLDRVIASLEELQSRTEAAANPDAPKPAHRPGRKFMDEEARRQVSERMKAYWEERRKQRPPTEAAE